MKTPLKFDLNSVIDKKSALVVLVLALRQIITWTNDVLTHWCMHTCATQPQWVNFKFANVYKGINNPSLFKNPCVVKNLIAVS